MDFFYWILILCGAVGAGFLLYSAVGFAAPKAAAQNGVSLDDRLEAYGDTLTEADAAINELNDLSKDVFSRFDEKYKELLFLYNLIDEKKLTAEAHGGVDVTIDDARDPRRAAPRKAYKNERFASVLKLREEGLAAEAIAKQLNIGKGEVALILELNKRA